MAAPEYDDRGRLKPQAVDANAYNYGGDPGAAAAAQAEIQRKADAAQGRQGEQINTANADAARQGAGSTRAAQLRMADIMTKRATGQTPSIAGMRADNDQRKLVADQSSIAASARGPAGLALASQQAAGNSAAGTSAISNSAQINSAQERSDAEKSAFGAYSAVNSGDQNQQRQDFSQGAAQAGMNAAQRQQNDAYQMQMQNQGIGIANAQMGGQMNRDAANQAHDFNAAGLQQKNDAADAAHDAEVRDEAKGWIGTGLQAAGTVASFASDERLKVPVTWGSGGAEPPDMGNSKWGTGSGTSSVDMSRLMAHQALDEQTSRESDAKFKDATTGGGPMAYDGMDALKRRDQEDAGLASAKQRNGLELTDKEQANATSAQRRMSGDLRDKMQAPAKTTAEKKAGDPSATEKGSEDPSKAKELNAANVSQALGDVGKAMQPGPRRAMGGGDFHYVPPVTYPSDDRTKLAAAWDEGHAAAVSDVKKLGGMSAADLIRHNQPAAQAVRGMKADAWDEGHARNVGTLGKEMPRAQMADAARSMAGVPYAYKPQYAGAEGQAKGEVNIGPVAQEMEKSPVAATAVKEGPNGMKQVDVGKLTKVLGATAASQQEQLDEQDAKIRSLMAQRIRGSR